MNVTSPLSAENLVIGYKDLRVAENLSFQVGKGEFFGVVGINGIGKSTLIRTLAGLQPSLGGRVLVQDKELEQYAQVALAKQISIVLTESTPSNNMTVRELVTHGRYPYTNWFGKLSDHDIEHIESVLSRLTLESLAHKKCHTLSDGQLQRAHMARALAQDTPLILLDEPTTHLDLSYKVRIFKLLKSMAHELGKTIICTTHDIEMALQLCDKILVLDGNDNSFGRPEELIENGSFEHLFPKEIVQFHPKTRTFRIKG